jgi:CheY-like chemotaxis protein
MHVFAPSQHRLTMRPNHVAPPPRKPLVLVVEDDECARNALAMLLNDDYDVVEAANGREALATLAKGARPDVILLDLVMPQMDGWEFMQRQRSDWRLCTVPTIVMTGVASHDPRCLEMPIVRFLQKPYSGEQVLAAVSAELARPAHHSA